MSASTALNKISPSEVWTHFAKLSQIPRGSGNEERAVAFVVQFAREHGLDTSVDQKSNVVVRKPASVGMENHPIVALQSHLDMVQQQASGRNFDFSTEGIALIVEDDWVRADHTTLGADNGLGVALSMAVLAATDISHPPIEALFTVDEEVGMSGAEAITADQLKARYLINLDMESDTDLTIGCAGAVDILGDTTFDMFEPPNDSVYYDIELIGGLGGHSGLDIHLGRMNAIVTLATALVKLAQQLPVSLVRFDAPGIANVIPGRAKAQFCIKKEQQSALQTAINSLSEVTTFYRTNEPDAQIRCSEVSLLEQRIFDEAFQAAFLDMLMQLPDGVVSMHADVDGLVETSNNLASVSAANGQMSFVCLARSCIEAHKKQLIERIESAVHGLNVHVSTKNDAPGWEPQYNSELLRTMKAAYKETQGTQPGIIAIHAGLETGILSNTFPHTDMVSYGPNIRYAHSSDERVQISSVQKVWEILKKTLSSIPHSAGVRT